MPNNDWNKPLNTSIITLMVIACLYTTLGLHDRMLTTALFATCSIALFSVGDRNIHLPTRLAFASVHALTIVYCCVNAAQHPGESAYVMSVLAKGTALFIGVMILAEHLDYLYIPEAYTAEKELDHEEKLPS